MHASTEVAQLAAAVSDMRASLNGLERAEKASGQEGVQIQLQALQLQISGRDVYKFVLVCAQVSVYALCECCMQAAEMQALQSQMFC
jgi:hypothetical protein